MMEQTTSNSSRKPTARIDSLLDDPATDPTLGAAIFEMRARWPDVGRDADHPLADHLARRAKFDPPLGMGIILIMLAAVVFESWAVYELIFPGIGAFGFYVWAKSGGWYESAQRQDIQLTPFPLRQMAAVQAAVALADYRSRRSQFLRHAFHAVFWTAALVKIALLIDEFHPRPPALLAIGGLLALLAVMIRSYTDVRRTIIATISCYTYSPTISVPLRPLTALLLIAVAAVGGASFSLRYRVAMLPEHARNAFLLLGMLSFAAAFSFHSDMRRDFVTPWYRRCLRTFDKVESKRRVD